MMKLRALQSTLCLTLALSITAFASPRSDAWKLQRTDPQAALSQLQQVAQNDPNDAKTFWFMAMILDDLGRGEEGLQALKTAQRLDPSLSFASNPSGVSAVERSLLRKSGGASSSRPDAPVPNGGFQRDRESDGAGGGVTMPVEQQKEIGRALQANGVWVDPAMQNVADAGAIAQAIKGANRPVKVLCLQSSPGGASLLDKFTQAMHKRLDLKDGLMIVVTNQPRDVAIYGGAYLYNDQPEMQKIVLASAKTFDAEGYPQGIAQIVRNFDAAEAGQASTGRNALLFIIGVPAGAIFLLSRRNKKKRADELAQLRDEVRDESAKLAPALEKLDSDYEFAIVAEQDPERKRLLQEHRNRAGEAFSLAMKQSGAAETQAEFAGAHGALQSAKAQMQRARNVLEGRPENDGVAATQSTLHGGNTRGAFDNGGAQQNDDWETPPLGANYAGAQPGYALDFFTSQPVPRDQMVPVDMEINGQRRRVWASPQSAQQAMNGQAQIATVNHQGQQYPWFNAPQQYNPWSDFGSNMLQMVAMNMMINSMFNSGSGIHHHYHDGGGYSDGGGGNWRDNNDYSDRGADYDNRIEDTSGGAGVASLDAPFAGGWTDSDSDSGGASSSLDIFGGGGGGWSGGDSS